LDRWVGGRGYGGFLKKGWGFHINARARTHTTRGGLDIVDGVAT